MFNDIKLFILGILSKFNLTSLIIPNVMFIVLLAVVAIVFIVTSNWNIKWLWYISCFCLLPAFSMGYATIFMNWEDDESYSHSKSVLRFLLYTVGLIVCTLTIFNMTVNLESD